MDNQIFYQNNQTIYTANPMKGLEEKLAILADAAKYDVACTSSGVSRSGKKGYLGNSVAAGVCHSFAADGRCISLLKILMSNACIYDCKYCCNRISNDIPRATFTPEEICTLTIEFYKRNYIEGLFLSSGVIGSPDKTMEKICETLRLLRTKYKFNGYIHVKAIPGASSELLYSAGLLADRISINMEMPTNDSLQNMAPDKDMSDILLPMNQIADTIARFRVASGKSALFERAKINNYLVDSIWGQRQEHIEGGNGDQSYKRALHILSAGDSAMQHPAERKDIDLGRTFAPGGQSTQMIIGASGETDYQLIHTSQALYRKFDLRRVFYSAYIPLNEDAALPALGTPVPLLREHRLYQADWLLRYYGFYANEIVSADQPNLDYAIDPKCNWALRHMELFPVEINTATPDVLLRIPGIGPTGVKKILSARRYGPLNFDMLKKMRIVLKRARYFITCGGKTLGLLNLDDAYIRRCLTDECREEAMQITDSGMQYRQTNLFTDFGLGVG